jgi:hypothetical protein
MLAHGGEEGFGIELMGGHAAPFGKSKENQTGIVASTGPGALHHNMQISR